jgi:hypothetical protein
VNGPHVVLVGCTKSKRTEPAAGRDLYDPSDLFRRRRAYAESTGLPWGIVSALYGLVEPTQVVKPYEMTIAQRATAEHGGTRHWARSVLRRSFELAGMTATARDARGFAYFPEHLVVEVHAGIDYVRALRDVAGDYRSGVTVLHPVAGLMIGQQKQHYAGLLAEPADEIPTTYGQLALAL